LPAPLRVHLARWPTFDTGLRQFWLGVAHSPGGISKKRVELRWPLTCLVSCRNGVSLMIVAADKPPRRLRDPKRRSYAIPHLIFWGAIEQPIGNCGFCWGFLRTTCARLRQNWRMRCVVCVEIGLFRLAGTHIHGEGGERRPLLSLTMFQLVALGGGIGADPPIGVRGERGAFDGD